jgi:hypothetical protein
MPARTELIWDGKYDANGKRVAPLRVPLPFQTVETINETAQERNRNLFQHAAQEQPWRNRLIWGDKKYVLPSLLPEFAGKVNLIYIDPPFDTGADFSFTATVPEHEDDDDSLAFTEEPSIIEQKAYRDTWGRGLDSYLQWFYETVVILHELLAENGSIYVHLDHHVGHYCKIIIDEIFGTDSFINAITWKRSDAHSDVGQGAKHLGQICDSIFFYAKNGEDFAIKLLSIADVRPFVVQNLGKYERQLWQTGQFAETRGANAPRSEEVTRGANAPRSEEVTRGANAPRSEEVYRAYVDFILRLYHATPLHGRTWLHGVKGGRMVHVGGVDGPVTAGDVTQIAAEFKKAMGSGKDAPTTNGVDVLGWDFAFEINEVSRQQAEAANIQMRFKRIPKGVMDKRAVDQGDIHFFELAALGVERKIKGRGVTLTLTDFVIPPDDVPEEVRAAVKHWSQWIDYWAVDWDNKGDTFHNQWQTFRTRKDNKLALTASHKYEEAGTYRIVVKVIDLLGNDTTKTLTVQVK